MILLFFFNSFKITAKHMLNKQLLPHLFFKKGKDKKKIHELFGEY